MTFLKSLVLVLLSVSLFTASVRAAESARAALSSHMEAINSLDTDIVIESQHFPFGHLWPRGEWKFTQSVADFQPIDRAKLGAEWHHSVIEDAEEIVVSGGAATYRIEFTRRRADNSIIGRYQAIWVVTKIADQWKVQFRHGAIPLK